MTIAYLTPDDFEAMVINADGTVVVGFTAQWCAPCRSLTAGLETLRQQFGTVAFFLVDIDTHEGLASRNSIAGIPAAAVYRNGETIGSFLGADGIRRIAEVIAGTGALTDD